jgi:transposase-like protein
LYSRKQNIPAHRLVKDIDVDIKTAWFTIQRLHEVSDITAFQQFSEMTKDLAETERIYELDETYLGGSNSNRHWDKKAPRCQGRSWKDKIPIFVMVERGGNAIAKVVPNVEKETLEPIIRKYIKDDSTVNTDEFLSYKGLEKRYKHLVVNHKKKQYAKGEASVNTAESFNAHLKDNYWTYRHISRKYAPRYIKEFVFRWNTRKLKDKERYDLLLNSIVGKRLTYKELIRG